METTNYENEIVAEVVAYLNGYDVDEPFRGGSLYYVDEHPYITLIDNIETVERRRPFTTFVSTVNVGHTIAFGVLNSHFILRVSEISDDSVTIIDLTDHTPSFTEAHELFLYNLVRRYNLD